jgi:uncharacterized membrane protein YozB (DUF420 family)
MLITCNIKLVYCEMLIIPHMISVISVNLVIFKIVKQNKKKKSFRYKNHRNFPKKNFF